MKIGRFHILTASKLRAKLEEAESRERQLTSAMMEKLVGDNVILSNAVKGMKWERKRWRK